MMRVFGAPSAAALLAVALAVLRLPVTAGAGLRRGGSVARTTALEEPEEEKDPIKEIQEKWDKMDEFSGIMFNIACKWKHGKDVTGLAAAKVKDGDLKFSDVEDFKNTTRTKNIQHLKDACGHIVAKGKKKCREGCGTRWGRAMERRAKCDAKCRTVYGNFEKSCRTRAANLQMVYEAKAQAGAARKQCYTGHCSEFPTAWLKASKDDMQAEVDKQCEGRCTEEKIKESCERTWVLKVDFIRPKIESTCFAEGEAQECFKKKKGKVSEADEKCTSDGEKTCGDQYKECNEKGKTDKTFGDAKAFCDDRKKMCKEQVSKNCQGEYKASLEKAKKECEEADAEAMGKCEEEKLEEKQKEEQESCVKDKTPKCPKDCKAKCKVEAMRECLDNLKTDGDETELFCKDLWRLLHDSSELDQTGDPVVLLAPAAAAPARRA